MIILYIPLKVNYCGREEDYPRLYPYCSDVFVIYHWENKLIIIIIHCEKAAAS